ncbi:hypothetical protein [Hungatella effluvii]|uniref:hypothetical protein n=1 Tax=Hungatella effluvii TaxID=1096246 RepID=UPI002A822974|nr:hypothetical protein [Hungatella effluvii]
MSVIGFAVSSIIEDNLTHYPWHFLTIVFRTFVCYDKRKKEIAKWQEYAPWQKTLTSARIIAGEHRHAMVARKNAVFIKNWMRRSSRKRQGAKNGLSNI